jgi:hypothetical protein
MIQVKKVKMNNGQVLWSQDGMQLPQEIHGSTGMQRTASVGANNKLMNKMQII